LALYFIEITAAHVRGENCSAFPSVAGKHASQGRLAGPKRADHERQADRVYGVANFFSLFSPDPNRGVVSAHLGHENQYELRLRSRSGSLALPTDHPGPRAVVNGSSPVRGVAPTTTRLGELRRGETIPWRVIAAQLAPRKRRDSR
jgi:hypothetical protein